MGWIYILKSRLYNTYYVGSTKNLSRRETQHKKGKSKYTRNILPIELVFSQEFKTYREARKAECWLKNKKTKH